MATKASSWRIRFGTTKARIPHYRSRIRWEQPIDEVFDSEILAHERGQSVAAKGHTVYEVIPHVK